MIRALLAVLLLVSTAQAQLDTLVVTGNFTQQRNPGYFGLSLPIPFEYTVTFSRWAQDLDPSPLFGLYKTPGAYTTLRFGPNLTNIYLTNFYVSVEETELHVWAGKDGLREAIGFGTAHAFTAFGVATPDYFLYALFPNLFGPFTPGWDDSIHWVWDVAGDSRFQLLSYVFWDGDAGGVETLLETGSAQSYSVFQPIQNLK